MPAVFDGFVERWNRAVERELRRELAEGERKEKLLVVSRGEGDGRRLAEQARSVERIRKKAVIERPYPPSSFGRRSGRIGMANRNGRAGCG